MEHLRHDINRITVDVPFEAEEREYGVDDFFTYPESKGQDGVQLIEKGPLSNIPSQDVGKFLQSWLFFALLSRVLCVSVNTQDFIRTNENEDRFLTTEELPKLLEDWKKREEAGDPAPNNRSRRHIMMDRALNEASKFISKWCSEIDERLCLSFSILGETLTRARLKILEPAGTHGMLYWQNINQRYWGSSIFLKKYMLGRKWCPSMVHMLQKTLEQVSGLYLASLFEDPENKHQHEAEKKCDDGECALETVDEKKFPLHHKQNCKCTSLGPDERRLAAILEKENIPLVSLKRDGKLILEEFEPPKGVTLEMSPRSQVKYGAVSHVWADGLGNPNQNSLPRCQLLFLQGLFSEGGQKMPFWIDTLCIPRAGELRKLGIKGMRKVYESCHKVIVLDRSLQKSRCNGPNPLEAAIRINMSKWARRLWTLQEGSLCRKLYFFFEDGMISSTDLEERFQKAEGILHNSWAKAGQLFSPTIRSLRTPAVENKVSLLWKAVQWRSTTRRGDETICLATLLDMDPTGLMDLQAGQRMPQFLSMLDASFGIPPGMIFLPAPKLRDEGYGWAPESWMTRHESEYPDPLFLKTHPAFLTKRGLLVQYPGIILHLPEVPTQNKFWFPVSLNLTQWFLVEYISDSRTATHGMSVDMPHEPEGGKRAPWSEINKRHRQLAIILSRSNPQDTPEIGLLVSATQKRDEIHWVQCLCRVWISLEQNQERIRSLADSFKSDSAPMIWGELLEDDQRWCVDKEYQRLSCGHCETTFSRMDNLDEHVRRKHHTI
jgi:hypothetical protein